MRCTFNEDGGEIKTIVGSRSLRRCVLDGLTCYFAVDSSTQRSAESPSSEEERSPHGFVLYDYVASQPDELSLKVGHI